MPIKEFNINHDGPTLVYPNGGEQIFDTTINITWNESNNISSTTDIIWYELFIVEDYNVKSYPNLIQIATLPSGTTSFIYTINKNLKGKKCRIGIRARNHKGQYGDISFSADNFSILKRKMPLPSVFEPVSNSIYFSYIPIVLDKEGVIGRCSQRAFYQIYYKSEKIGILDWRLIFSNIMINSDPIKWDVSNFLTSSDYSLKIEIVDGDNISEPTFIDNITINNINYFIIDTIPPIGEIKIQNVSEYTNKRDLVLSLKSSDKTTAVKDYRIEQTNIDGTVEMGIYSNVTDNATWNITGEDGEKIIEARFRDYGDNVIVSSNQKYFRTYKNLDNINVSAILRVEDDIWMAFGDDDSGIYQLFRNNTFISNLDSMPTSLVYYNNTLYVSIKDNENKGILQRYSGGEIESVIDNESSLLEGSDVLINTLYTSDSVISSMEVFNEYLFLGLENGKLIRFNGSIINLIHDDYANIKSIKKIKTDGNVLYIYYYNSIEILIMSQENNTYIFSVVEV